MCTLVAKFFGPGNKLLTKLEQQLTIRNIQLETIGTIGIEVRLYCITGLKDLVVIPFGWTNPMHIYRDNYGEAQIAANLCT
mmetsp:Transcript_3953/g.6507  ORF Transcript_3953/g.6507 Transcript_3953/m.6507 type:complete len:81 (-) Transcript_3953:35-277(-)